MTASSVSSVGDGVERGRSMNNCTLLEMGSTVGLDTHKSVCKAQ